MKTPSWSRTWGRRIFHTFTPAVAILAALLLSATSTGFSDVPWWALLTTFPIYVALGYVMHGTWVRLGPPSIAITCNACGWEQTFDADTKARAGLMLHMEMEHGVTGFEL